MSRIFLLRHEFASNGNPGAILKNFGMLSTACRDKLFGSIAAALIAQAASAQSGIVTPS